MIYVFIIFTLVESTYLERQYNTDLISSKHKEIFPSYYFPHSSFLS
jgi:hypothetical protein